MAATQTWFCGKASLAMGMKNSGSATSRSDRVTENMFNCCTECSRVNFGDQSRISSCEELPQYINWRDFPAGHATRAIIVGTQPWVLGSHFFSFFFFRSQPSGCVTSSNPHEQNRTMKKKNFQIGGHRTRRVVSGNPRRQKRHGTS